MTSFFRALIPLFTTAFIGGIILTIMAPYGTQDFTLPARLTYWIGLCAAGGLGASGFEHAARRKGWARALWPRALWNSLGATLAVYVVLMALNIIIYKRVGLWHALILPIFIWLISIIICGIAVLMESRKDNTTPMPPPLLKRLKLALREAEIYALSAEDHYVRVHSSKGDQLILMRLSDAISEMAPADGLSPHRSWWVAQNGVSEVGRKDGKLTITLKNSQIVPVSRTKTKAVKAAGWV